MVKRGNTREQQSTRVVTHIVEYGQGCHDGIDEVDTGEDARWILLGVQEGHEGTASDANDEVLAVLKVISGRDVCCLRGNDANNNPRPSMRLPANPVAHQEGKEDADSPRGHVHKGCTLRIVSKITDQSGRVCGDDAA